MQKNNCVQVYLQPSDGKRPQTPRVFHRGHELSVYSFDLHQNSQDGADIAMVTLTLRAEYINAPD